LVAAASSASPAPAPSGASTYFAQAETMKASAGKIAFSMIGVIWSADSKTI
jgi:hypothetical protein